MRNTNLDMSLPVDFIIGNLGGFNDMLLALLARADKLLQRMCETLLDERLPPSGKALYIGREI
jgi:hypothetical protein